jgi:NADH-quinone oxidoreductase subunit H
MDQLMAVAWKFMLPMSLVNLFVAGLWLLSPPGVTRWIACSLLVIGSYVFLARGMAQNGRVSKRVYRYAE